MRWTLTALVGLLAGMFVSAADVTPPIPSVDRGKQALLGKHYVPPPHSLKAYQSVWKQWGLASKPAEADYDRLFRERYGLHPAPYSNGNLPMGLREAPGLLGLN